MQDLGMSTYRVGGAVRDTLLGLPIHETDWVVVGGSAEQMRAAGFTAPEQKSAGASPSEMRIAGYSSVEMRDAGFSAKKVRGGVLGSNH